MVAEDANYSITFPFHQLYGASDFTLTEGTNSDVESDEEWDRCEVVSFSKVIEIRVSPWH